MNSDYCNYSDEEDNKANDPHTSKEVSAAKSKFTHLAKTEHNGARKPSAYSQSQEENASKCIPLN
jgi:hypothetical protein